MVVHTRESRWSPACPAPKVVPGNNEYFFVLKKQDAAVLVRISGGSGERGFGSRTDSVSGNLSQIQ